MVTHRDSPAMVARIDQVLDDIAATAEHQTSDEWASTVTRNPTRYEPPPDDVPPHPRSVPDLDYLVEELLFTLIRNGAAVVLRDPDGTLRIE